MVTYRLVGSPTAGVLSPAAALVPIVVHDHAGGDAGDDYQ
jgi:hypothetical protein